MTNCRFADGIAVCDADLEFGMSGIPRLRWSAKIVRLDIMTVVFALPPSFLFAFLFLSPPFPLLLLPSYLYGFSFYMSRFFFGAFVTDMSLSLQSGLGGCV